MLNLLIIDNNHQFYAGKVGAEFSTLMNAALYSEKIDDVNQAIKFIIETHQLALFDNYHSEELIKIDDDGIYFIDCQNKIIGTNSQNESIRKLTKTDFLDMFTSYESIEKKKEYFINARSMFEIGLFDIDNLGNSLAINCIDAFLNETKDFHLSFVKFEEYLLENPKACINLNCQHWNVMQVFDQNMGFYNGLFTHLLEQNLLLNSSEREHIELFLRDALANHYVDKLDSLLAQIDAKTEKCYLEDQIGNKNIKQHKIKI